MHMGTLPTCFSVSVHNNTCVLQEIQQEDSGIGEGGVRVEVVSGGEVRSDIGGDAVVDFPLDHLARLDEQLSRPKWVVPVRHDDDLERLLRASIRLCKEGEL